MKLRKVLYSGYISARIQPDGRDAQDKVQVASMWGEAELPCPHMESGTALSRIKAYQCGTRKLHLALGSSIFIGVSSNRHNWLNHCLIIKLSPASSPPKMLGLGDQSSKPLVTFLSFWKPAPILSYSETSGSLISITRCFCQLGNFRFWNFVPGTEGKDIYKTTGMKPQADAERLMQCRYWALPPFLNSSYIWESLSLVGSYSWKVIFHISKSTCSEAKSSSF